MRKNKSRSTSVRCTSLILIVAIFSLTFFSCTDEALELNTSAPQEATTLDTGSTTTAVTPVDCSTCKYVVPAGVTSIDGVKLGIQPGDVIGLTGTIQYGVLRFINIVGTAAKPVTVRVCGSLPVSVSVPITNSYGVKFQYSKYFRLTGGSVDGVYGIKVKGGNIGMTFDNLTTNFEVDHVEVSNVGFAGIMAKTDPTCDDATIRGNFVMTDVLLHHNYVHDTGGEGLYVGNSFYKNGVSKSCGIRFPSELKNIRIYSNRVVNSGWEAIQLGSAVSGAEVHSNVIENYGVKNVNAQNNGIQLGEGTGGLCYNNYIKGGRGSGMIVLGLGDNKVYNNIILNAGNFGIFCDDRYTAGTGFNFVNNTIINPASDGIRLYADNPALNNTIINNLIANPGSYGKYTSPRTGNDSYVYLLNSDVKVKISNNWNTRATLLANYLVLGSFSTAILNNCPLVDRGTNASMYGVTFDFKNTLRPLGVSNDIGAVEYK